MQGISIHRTWGALMLVAILSLTVTADADLVTQSLPFRKQVKHTSQDAIPPSFAHTNQDGDEKHPPFIHEPPIFAEWHDHVTSTLKLISKPFALDDSAAGALKSLLDLDLADPLAIDSWLDAPAESSWLEPMSASGGGLPLLMSATSPLDLLELESTTSDGVGPFIAQPIPVPGAIALLGVGVAGALVRGRRRRS